MYLECSVYNCGGPIHVSMLRVNTRIETQGDRTGGEERHNTCPEEKQGSDERHGCTFGLSPCAFCADALGARLRLPAPLGLVLVALLPCVQLSRVDRGGVAVSKLRNFGS